MPARPEHAAFWRYVEAHAHYDRGRPRDFSNARAALEEAIKTGPRTTWFRRLSRTAEELAGHHVSAGASHDELFLAWDEWIRESGPRIERQLSMARTKLAGSHDERSEALVILARLAGAHAELPPKTEQSATDCRWQWITPRRSERRVWEVKTGKFDRLPRDDVNQLLGQIEVERKRAARARVLGCLLTPVADVEDDAAEAARDKITLVHHGAAVRLFDLLADRLNRYRNLWEDGRAEARGTARTTVEPLLPRAGWLGRLLSPSAGRVIDAESITAVFPSG